MLEFKAEEIDWAVEKLSAFDGRTGYPGNTRALEAHAAALLRIAHPVLVSNKIGEVVVVEDPLSKPADILEGVVIDHPKIGPVKPVDWLIAECMDKQVFFPQPVTMRQIFCQYFPPADGREPVAHAEFTEGRKSEDNG